MKKIKTLCTVTALAACTLLGAAGCGTATPVVVEPIPSDTLYVEKVENMKLVKIGREGNEK